MSTSPAIAAKPGFSAIVRLAVDTFRIVARADHATVYLLAPDGRTLVCVGTSRADATRVVGARLVLEMDSLHRTALSSGRVLTVEPEQAGRLSPSDGQDVGVTPALVVPMLRAGRPVGTAVIEVSEARHWDSGELAAIAENARVAAQPLDDAARDAVFLGALDALLEAFEALGRVPAGDDLAAAVARHARTVGGCEAAWVRYPSPDEGSLVVRVDAMLPEPEALEVRSAVSAAHGGERLQADAPLYYPDAMRGMDVPPDVRRLALAAELGSILIWPLVVHAQITGDVAFLRREREGFTPEQIAVAGAFARFAGPLLLVPVRRPVAPVDEAAQTSPSTDRAGAGLALELARSIVEGVPVPAILETRDGSVGAVNRAFGLTFNVNPGALVGASFHAVAVPAVVRLVEGEEAAGQVLSTLRAGPAAKREHAFELRGARGGPVIYRAHPLHAGLTELVGRLHVFAPPPGE